jgi:hypothetical protein
MATTPYRLNPPTYENYECLRHLHPHHTRPHVQQTRHPPPHASTKVAGKNSLKFTCYEARSCVTYL